MGSLWCDATPPPGKTQIRINPYDNYRFWAEITEDHGGYFNVSRLLNENRFLPATASLRQNHKIFPLLTRRSSSLLKKQCLYERRHFYIRILVDHKKVFGVVET
jgi:hypothetical protein